jgi:hypothetical protein
MLSAFFCPLKYGFAIAFLHINFKHKNYDCKKNKINPKG